jgi:hypothetical protein
MHLVGSTTGTEEAFDIIRIAAKLMFMAAINAAVAPCTPEKMSQWKMAVAVCPMKV